MNHVTAQCVRCHNYQKGKGSTIGPNLKSIGGTQDHSYIFESIINPQAVIAPGYGSISLPLKNGENVAGQFRKETQTEVEVQDAEGKSTKILIEEIESHTSVIPTMALMFALLNKHEIRYLVAYLATLKST